MGLGGFTSPRARAEFEERYAAGLRLLPEPAETRDVPTAFGTVRVYRFGSGSATPLVLVPGRASTSVLWAPNLRELTSRGPVYAIDPLGEPGGSTQTVALRGGADNAAWLDAVFDGLGLARLHLLGYSFGGWLVANQAARLPDRLASLTLLEPVNTLTRFPAELLLRTTLAAIPGISRWARPSFQRWISGGEPVTHDDPLAALIDAGMRGYRMAVSAPAYLTDGQLRGIGVPTLVLLGGRSVILHPHRAAQRARRLLPDARVHVWPRATHAMPSESPAEVNAAVLEFLGGVAA